MLSQLAKNLKDEEPFHSGAIMEEDLVLVPYARNEPAFRVPAEITNAGFVF